MTTASDKLRIVVLGYIVRGPLGGLCWHHAQYAMGLQDLGHEVCFLEDSGTSQYCCFHPLRGVTEADPSYGLGFAADLFKPLAIDWAYYDRHRGQWHGPASPRALELCRSADVVINLSLANPLDHGLEETPVRIAVDTDPLFTQVRNLTDPARRALTASHNRFFTFGENLPHPGSPDDGFAWRPTRQPVVLRLWPVREAPERAPFTTVMQWDSYPPREWEGVTYGQKSHSFQEFFDLPRHCPEALELVLGSPSAPRDRLQSAGWKLRNPNQAALTPAAFQDYLRASKAEFTVAKHGYVAGRSGWFSERSANYLASGRPVVTQDTGFSTWVPVGAGVISFRDCGQALAAIEEVAGNLRKHSRAARELASAYFDSMAVLSRMLEAAQRG